MDVTTLLAQLSPEFSIAEFERLNHRLRVEARIRRNPAARLSLAPPANRAWSWSEETNMHVREMIGSHPEVMGSTTDALLACIEACYDGAQTCAACADACLAEPSVEELRRCIRLNLDCADICTATGSIASRRTASNIEVMREVVRACATACRTCAHECRVHAEHHEHCRVCADTCERCAAACSDALAQIH